MSCFCCGGKSKGGSENIGKNKGGNGDQASASVNAKKDAKEKVIPNPIEDQLSLDLKMLDMKEHSEDGSVKRAKSFTFLELAEATGNFRSDYFLGEGGFGKVYKGCLERTNQIVAIKQLNPEGLQGIKEFVVEVLTLSLADHPNLVKLIGYCAEESQRLLVYEYMPLGTLEYHLHELPPGTKALDWNTRMKIATEAARGLEYLHHKMETPIIYRDIKSANILLDVGYHAKLSDFGLAKVGPVEGRSHVSTRVMGTYGYCAPDYAMTGQLTFKSDIYSFGVVLLELITGRRAVDITKVSRDQYLVAWARLLFKDRRKFPEMADPLLEGQYPLRGLYQALAIAAMCVQEQPNMRPVVTDLVNALNFLSVQNFVPRPTGSPSSAREERRSDDRGKEKLDDDVVSDRGKGKVK